MAMVMSDLFFSRLLKLSLLFVQSVQSKVFNSENILRVSSFKIHAKTSYTS